MPKARVPKAKVPKALAVLALHVVVKQGVLAALNFNPIHAQC